jgi:hypothetical protein
MFCPTCQSLSVITRKLPNEINAKVSTSDRDFTYCESCGYYEKLKNLTTIYSDKKKKVSKLTINPQMVVMDIYPRQGKYTCCNKKCTSHKTGKGSLVLYKDKDYRTFNVCTECLEIQKNDNIIVNS